MVKEGVGEGGRENKGVGKVEWEERSGGERERRGGRMRRGRGEKIW